MHITRIELEDIKSHAHFAHEFQRGTTAITGENGAGKTTLIEAIAWTLFDLLEYKKDDFVRRGAKKGIARVTFESGLDGREYTVYRDTGNGYNIYDPSLKLRIADKKEEVSRFLFSHLGVEPGTDLKSLFQCAIGVPQGTFTSDFLLTPEKRKPIFDKLLRVEDYRKSSDKLRDTARFIETKIASVRERIARAEGELSRFEVVEKELKDFQKQGENLSKTLSETEKEVEEKRTAQKKFEEIEARVNELKKAFERLETERSRLELVLAQRESEFNQASAAEGKIKLVRADFERHLKALGTLKELEREQSEREKIRQEILKIENALANVRSDKKRFLADLEKAQNAHREIENLKPKVAEQEKIEKELAELRKRLNEIKLVEGQIKTYEIEISRLREDYKSNKAKLDEAKSKSAAAENLEKLQRRDDDLKRDLANFRAKLEADQKFQSEIKNGLCPILSEKCLNLKPGQTLEAFLASQFNGLKSQIAALENEQKKNAAELQISRDAEKSLAALETYKAREIEITEKGKDLSKDKENLEKQIKDLEKIQTELNEKESYLRAIGSPREKAELLQKDADREKEFSEKLAKVEKNLEHLEKDLQTASQKLEKYRDLDSKWREFSEERDRTADAHRDFLVNEKLAKTLPEKRKDYETAKTDLEKITQDLAQSERDFGNANKEYDRERHQTERVALLEAERRLAETRANFVNTKTRAEQLEKELAKLAEIRKALQNEFREKERLEKVLEATDFIRETLKKSAPLMAKNYIYYISLEANQMFREITGNAERTLKWTEDYGIVLEENGYERPFVNLSGGEQMAAALSVRLALLKQLSDVRLAFFDEPTTNMDAARRERLAEQISHITERKTFDQLFVISHDDTFEGYVDYVVSVGTVA